MSYEWTKLYKEFSNVLLGFKDDRLRLLSLIKEIYLEIGDVSIKYPFDYRGVESNDVGPFSVFACFNKGISLPNKIKLLNQFKNKFNLVSNVPESFEGIPEMNPLNSWFYGSSETRGANDIDNLWELLEKAINYADRPNEKSKKDFTHIYDIVRNQKWIKWNITSALFWIRPFDFMTLDSNVRNFFNAKGRDIFPDTSDLIRKMKVPPTGEEYLNLTQVCKGELNSKDNPEPEVRTLIDISVRAYSEDYFDEKKGDVRFYMYSPGINAAKWKDFYSDEIIAIGWDEVDDLNNYSSRTEIVNKLREINEDNESHKNDSKALDDFKNEMRIGDIVYVKKGLKTILGRGVIKSDYYYDENAEEYKHRRKILWTHEVNFDHHWHNIVQKKLTNITYYKDYCRDLEELFSNEVIKIDNEKLDHNETVFADDDFIKLVYMKPEKYKSIVDTLLNKKNIILQGPPGVGKTFSSKLLAYSIMGKKDDERIQMVQFHQNYGYEDFVMGYRPNEDGFILKNGPFYEFCNKIRKDENENKKYFFIIDEINRGNLSRIFGELLMLIENDKRNHPIKLMYNSEEFSVPSNLYIIGLMNTADRSLAMIDYALRRRFAFIDLEPAFDSDGFKDMISRKYIDTKINIVLNYIKSINRDILEDENLGEGFLIGHSYFCPNDNEQVDDAWLESKLRHEIIPLLKEYWFDERGRVANYSNDLLGIFR